MNAAYQGLVPYLFYDDAGAAMDWYLRYFEFEELGRWKRDDGAVQNGEMKVGTTELWLDGGGCRRFSESGDDRPQWVGVWVDDVDAIYERLLGKGLSVTEPVTREFGVRMLNVEDPFGYLWGFVCRVAV